MYKSQPSFTPLKMTHRNLRELAVELLGDEVALSFDGDFTKFENCASKISQIEFLRDLRGKYESLRSLRRRHFMKLFDLTKRAYVTICKKEVLDKTITYRAHMKVDVVDTMTAFLAKPGINFKKTNSVLADEYRRESKVPVVAMRKFAALLTKAKKAAKQEAYKL